MNISVLDDVSGIFDIFSTKQKQIKKISLQGYVFEPSFLKLAGDLTGKSVLDLGCGEGHYARLAKRLGAAEVLGVDKSAELIEAARAQEKAEPLGCEYRVGDAADLIVGRQFDLVFGVFLLNYAGSHEELAEMTGTIAKALKPGGRFIGLNTNMRLAQSHYGDCKRYGRWMSAPPNRREGDPIIVNFRNCDGVRTSLENRYLTPESYEDAFAEAGFADFHWVPVSVSKAGYDAYPNGHWNRLLSAPPVTGIEARK